MKIAVRKNAALLSLFIAGALTSMAHAEPKAGDEAPDFTMQGTDGKTYKLSDFKGKQAVVLAWFPKAKTPGCTLECKSFREFGKDLRAYDVAYFTASCDTPEFNKEFSEMHTLDFPILSDPDKSVAKAYGVVHDQRLVPERWTFYIGKDGKILYVDKEVKTAAHGKDVAAKLDELKVAKK
ncbi:MAG TPA: peroxiredoxin [Pirellulales bacterium]|nr:peroxiredoxin [Pirellulales bacterium]